MEKSEQEILNIAKGIRLLVLDVDGVLTDGSITFDNEGNELKTFYVRDGYGIKMLIEAGVQVAIITGRYSKIVEKRADELGITEVYQGYQVKSAAYKHLVEKVKISDGEVAYIGDDAVDISLLKKVGLPVAVADATKDTKAEARLITKKSGGREAVREVCELILKANGKWKPLMNERHKA
ncbi:3-deoxy-manno-octulosonate-8-phosphatase KdsC [Thermodesulfovibrionales bacterium]|nr:3-deoxy-manno-octulosonate-8-phosphatase KdsC [Thermodesulfovibrionales bacterium]